LQEAFVSHPRNIHDDANTIFEGLVQDRNRWDSIRKDGIDAGISHQREINFDLIRFGELCALAIWSKGPVSCSLDKKFLLANEKEFSFDPGAYFTGRECISAADGNCQTGQGWAPDSDREAKVAGDEVRTTQSWEGFEGCHPGQKMQQYVLAEESGQCRKSCIFGLQP
jgi:hypothetical protein